VKGQLPVVSRQLLGCEPSGARRHGYTVPVPLTTDCSPFAINFRQITTDRRPRPTDNWQCKRPATINDAPNVPFRRTYAVPGSLCDGFVS
jgi:hypothetical protein